MSLKRFSFLVLSFISLISFSAQAEWKTETIEGLQVHYYLPKNQTHPRALMVNLHGCSQKSDDLKKDGNWETTAEEFNLIVALPKVPNGGVYAGCWDYYGADHNRTNRHNGFLIKLTQNLIAKKELKIDPGQVYVSGLSSGGGESMVLGCLAPDLFAGIGLNAGPSTGTSANEISRPQTSFDKMLATCKDLAGTQSSHFKTQLTSIIYGNNDYIVSTAHDINNAEIMKIIYDAKEKSTFDTKKLTGTSTDGTGTLFSDAQGPRISLIMNTNLGHNWPAGQGGNGGSFINKKSINYPNYLATFFYSNNRRSKNVKLPALIIHSIQSENSHFSIYGKVSVPAEKVLIQLRSTNDDRVIDVLNANVDENNDFQAQTQSLPDGEYNFAFNVNSQMFYRNSWIGEIPGVNAPQLVNTKMESDRGCIKLNGQAVNNGGDKVVAVKVVINDDKEFQAPIKKTTKWNLNLCALPYGEHDVKVFAFNTAGFISNIYNSKLSLQFNSATSTLQEHMEAKRLKWEEYGFWYLKYGNARFTLYLNTDNVWSDILKNIF